jgi:hypothetical protein
MTWDILFPRLSLAFLYDVSTDSMSKGIKVENTTFVLRKSHLILGRITWELNVLFKYS